VDEEWQKYDKFRLGPAPLRWIGLAILIAAIIRYLTM
jgi:hypothetical protein